MAFVATDWSIASNGNIRYMGNAHGGVAPSYCTVLELHRALQNFADDASASGDDLVDINSPNPSERSTDNIVTLLNGYNIDDTAAEHLYDGSITQAGGDVVYAGLVVLGEVVAGTQLQIVQNNTLLTNYWGTGLNADPASSAILRLLVKVRTGGADIDGKRLRVQARELGASFAERSVTCGLGNTPAALSTEADLNNLTAAGTIAGWTDIVNVEGYQTIDLNNGNGARAYYSQWDRGSRTIAQLYERAKWIQRRGTATTIHGINGELFRGITHQWAYDTEASGPFVEDEILSWGSGATAGTGLLLARLDSGSTGTMWIQLLTGVVPADNTAITGGTSGATCLVNGAVTSRTVRGSFLGVYTGSSILGAFGIGIQAADLSAADRLTDLTNTEQAPPNQQSFSVTGVVVGEDRVLVAPNDGSGGIDYDQLTANGAQSSGASTFVVNETIPADTPASGSLRILISGVRQRVAYSSWTGSTFTLTGTLPGNVADDAPAYISYVDKLATATTEGFTSTYAGSDRSLVVIVRDGGGTPIKPFQTPATFGSAGGSVAAIRTPDV